MTLEHESGQDLLNLRQQTIVFQSLELKGPGKIPSPYATVALPGGSQGLAPDRSGRKTTCKLYNLHTPPPWH